MSAFYSWLITGLVLCVSEFFVPGFVIIFFGAGALLTSLITLVFPSLSVNFQTFLFFAFSIVSLLLFRRQAFGKGAKKNADVSIDYDDDFTGHDVVVIENIAPGKPGKVELNGVNWNASADQVLSAGERATVAARNGLTLIVRSSALQ